MLSSQSDIFPGWTNLKHKWASSPQHPNIPILSPPSVKHHSLSLKIILNYRCHDIFHRLFQPEVILSRYGRLLHSSTEFVVSPGYKDTISFHRHCKCCIGIGTWDLMHFLFEFLAAFLIKLRLLTVLRCAWWASS